MVDKMEEVTSLAEITEGPKRSGSGVLDFPVNPKDGDTHRSYYYDTTKDAWILYGETSVRF